MKFGGFIGFSSIVAFLVVAVGLFKEDIYTFLVGLWMLNIILMLEGHLKLKEWIKSELKTIKPKRKKSQ